MSEVVDTHHQVTHKNVFVERVFWSCVWGHMKSDIASTVLTIRNVGGVILAALLGVSLFLLEFALVKDFVVYVVVIPLAIFLVVKYLTILPMIFVFLFLFIQPKHAAISLSLISVFSFVWVLLM